MTTADKVLQAIESRVSDIKKTGSGKYRMSSPLRPGADSFAFTLIVNDGEHGAFLDHNPQGGPESGSLYDLAKLLGVELPPMPKNGNGKTPAPKYQNLADYARGHGVEEAVFTAAGWRNEKHAGRPALSFPTATGTKRRYLDGQRPKYMKRGAPCWYGLDKAAALPGPLIFCNGEASTVVGQHYGLAAVTTTAGESSKLPNSQRDNLLSALAKVYSGAIIVALDCDSTGRESAPKLAQLLQQAGYEARAVDLGLEQVDEFVH